MVVVHHWASIQIPVLPTESAMSPSPIEILASTFFALAVLHTFCVRRFAHWAAAYPEGSLAENLFHFLAETEIVFGIWAASLFSGIAALEGSLGAAIEYVTRLNFTEPKFVFVIMVMAGTRPVIQQAEAIITFFARLLPLKAGAAFYLTALSLGALLGSFITEPAAMTLIAILLKRRFFDRGISTRLAYATLGLLFVNISIGGTLTHFAAPPVLLVAEKWHWNTPYMFTHIGWRAAASCLTSALVTVFIFRKELDQHTDETSHVPAIPFWVTALHIALIALVVNLAHYPDVFFGVFMIFLGLVTATKEYQDELKLREGLLVGFFLAGLITLGSAQSWWLQPLIAKLDGTMMYLGATLLTAITDNAALAYLGTLVEGISENLKYALISGAVTGGGLTVIANAPNPAGAGILKDSACFKGEGISPLGLFIGALPPTFIATLFFWWLH
jgi:hypothetical protein